jgi:peptide/nickel transport system ATP-binding protein
VHNRRAVAVSLRVRDVAMTQQRPLLEIARLSVKFPIHGGVVEAVNDVSFTLERGRVVCLLGESGSGKTVTLRSIVRLNAGARTTGTIVLDGRQVLARSRREIREGRRGDAAMVFQEPMTALDPVYTVGAQIEETVRRHRNVNRIDARRRALELLELVQIPSPARCLAAYPHELSGGMRQRVMIAIALACDPALLLADEPTTALDVTVQAQILWLLRDLQRRLGLGLVLVTHDLGVAA